MNRSVESANKLLFGMFVTAGISVSTFFPVTAGAETGYFAIPSLSIAAVHDDNLFFDISEKASDLIARVSPALEVGYESETLTWSGSYRFDAETYDKYTDLDSSLARRFADAELEFAPTSRLTLLAKADYTKTNTLDDLSLVPGGVLQGLLIGRNEAERLSINPAMEYSITSTATGSLAYTQTNDKLFGGVKNDTYKLEADLEHKFSAKNAIGYGYIYRNYRFDDESGQNTVTIPSARQNSHTAWFGLSHKWSPRTSGTARVGPRYYQQSVEPYLLLSLRRKYTNGDLRVSYERDETTLLGDVGRVEAETLSATLSRSFGPNVDFQVVPAYGNVSLEGSDANIFRLAMEGKYRINDVFSITAAYDFYLQRVKFVGGDVERVSRNVIQLGVTFTWPRQSRKRDQSGGEN